MALLLLCQQLQLQFDPSLGTSISYSYGPKKTKNKDKTDVTGATPWGVRWRDLRVPCPQRIHDSLGKQVTGHLLSVWPVLWQ